MAKRERNWEGNKDSVLISFYEVWNTSFSSQFDDFNRWWFPSFLHHQVYRCILESHEKGILSNSLIFRRFTGWIRTIKWCILSSHSGVYEAIARELRFILEDLAQAIYVDQKLGDSGLVGKGRTVKILEDVRLRGTRLIEKIKVDRESKNEMKRLYDILCDYVHPSADLIQYSLTRETYFFKYDESQFRSLLELYTQVWDLIFSLVVSSFPASIERILWLGGSQEETLERFKKDGFVFTASVCADK